MPKDKDYDFDNSPEIADLLENEVFSDEIKKDMFSHKKINSSDIASKHPPGKMTGEVIMYLHTNQAHHLFYGRRRDKEKKLEPITGLIRFAGELNKIWVAAKNDDPYADYFLYQIEQILIKAEHHIQEQTQDLETKLSQLEKRGFVIQVQESESPVELSLNFAPEFTHKGALALLSFDYLVRLALTLKHTTVLNRKDWKLVVNNSGKNIRQAFETSLRFKHTGVTRDDVAANNAKAADAKSKMKLELPEAILQGIVRAEISPPLPANREATLSKDATIDEAITK